MHNADTEDLLNLSDTANIKCNGHIVLSAGNVNDQVTDAAKTELDSNNTGTVSISEDSCCNKINCEFKDGIYGIVTTSSSAITINGKKVNIFDNNLTNKSVSKVAKVRVNKNYRISRDDTLQSQLNELYETISVDNCTEITVSNNDDISKKDDECYIAGGNENIVYETANSDDEISSVKRNLSPDAINASNASKKIKYDNRNNAITERKYLIRNPSTDSTLSSQINDDDIVTESSICTNTVNSSSSPDDVKPYSSANTLQKPVAGMAQTLPTNTVFANGSRQVAKVGLQSPNNSPMKAPTSTIVSKLQTTPITLQVNVIATSPKLQALSARRLQNGSDLIYTAASNSQANRAENISVPKSKVTALIKSQFDCDDDDSTYAGIDTPTSPRLINLKDKNRFKSESRVIDASDDSDSELNDVDNTVANNEMKDIANDLLTKKFLKGRMNAFPKTFKPKIDKDTRSIDGKARNVVNGKVKTKALIRSRGRKLKKNMSDDIRNGERTKLLLRPNDKEEPGPAKSKWQMDNGTRHEILQRMVTSQNYQSINKANSADDLIPSDIDDVFEEDDTDFESEEARIFQRNWFPQLIMTKYDYLDRRSRLNFIRNELNERIRQVKRAKKLFPTNSDEFVKAAVNAAKLYPCEMSSILSSKMRKRKNFKGIQDCSFTKKKCRFNNCVNISLPYNDYCIVHILQCKNQVLFKKCSACNEKGVTCNRPALANSAEKSVCVMHSSKNIDTLPDLLYSLRNNVSWNIGMKAEEAEEKDTKEIFNNNTAKRSDYQTEEHDKLPEISDLVLENDCAALKNLISEQEKPGKDVCCENSIIDEINKYIASVDSNIINDNSTYGSTALLENNTNINSGFKNETVTDSSEKNHHPNIMFVANNGGAFQSRHNVDENTEDVNQRNLNNHCRSDDSNNTSGSSANYRYPNGMHTGEIDFSGGNNDDTINIHKKAEKNVNNIQRLDTTTSIENTDYNSIPVNHQDSNISADDTNDLSQYVEIEDIIEEVEVSGEIVNESQLDAFDLVGEELEHHEDIKSALKNIPVDAISDLFSEDENEKRIKETEELERAIQEVDNDVHIMASTQHILNASELLEEISSVYSSDCNPGFANNIVLPSFSVSQ